MNTRRYTGRFSIAILFGCSFLCRADTMVKIRTVITDSETNQNVENPSTTRAVHYRHAAMRRIDSLGAGITPSIADIANCETKTGLLIDLNTHEYRKYNVTRFASEAQRTEYLQKTGRTAVQVESKTVDTGERKQFFGHSAKHLITTTRPSGGNGRGGEATIDGWYIDHELPDRSCAPDFVRSEPYYVIGTSVVEYPDLAQVHHTGPLPTGMPVILKLTSKLAATKENASRRTITVEKTVEDLSDSPLSPSLFELPSGLHENPQLFRGRATSGQ